MWFPLLGHVTSSPSDTTMEPRSSSNGEELLRLTAWNRQRRLGLDDNTMAYDEDCGRVALCPIWTARGHRGDGSNGLGGAHRRDAVVDRGMTSGWVLGIKRKREREREGEGGGFSRCLYERDFYRAEASVTPTLGQG